MCCGFSSSKEFNCLRFKRPNHYYLLFRSQKTFASISQYSHGYFSRFTKTDLYFFEGGPTALSFSQDGTMLFSGGEDGSASAWNMETFELVFSINSVHHRNIISCLRSL